MTDRVLVDTSVWIEYFRVPKSSVFEEMTRLLKERRAFFTGLVALELIRGAKTEKELSVLDVLFRSIGRVNEQETTPIEAGRMGYRLARKGQTLGTVDLVIARIAIENQVALYSHDRHFHTIAKFFPLRLHGIEARS